MFRFNMLKKTVPCILAVMLLALSGCASGLEAADPTESTHAVDTPSLQLTFKPDHTNFVTFEDEDLNGAFHGDLEYFRVSDVMIKKGDTTLPLEDALRDGIITFPKIHYLAQMDAAAGNCYESVESKRGLTRFSYDYLSYELFITDDIYETPDDKQHHIRKILIAPTGCDPVSLYPELDQEDWGIEFEVASVSPTGITLNYTQSGGQLIGQLCTWDYQISRTDIVQAVFELDNAPRPESMRIQHNSESSITLDFEQRFGALERGEYLLYLYLHDDYDPEQVPPLVRNYHDMQCYTIEFSIP